MYCTASGFPPCSCVSWVPPCNCPSGSVASVLLVDVVRRLDGDVDG